MSTKHDLIRSGLGWGGLPTWMVYEDIRAGRLKVLDLEPYPIRPYSLFAFHRADTNLGPAANWMMQQFKEELPKACSTLAPLRKMLGIPNLGPTDELEPKGSIAAE